MYQCLYETYVDCPKRECAKCGWNPEVAKARLEAIKAKMMEQEENEE